MGGPRSLEGDEALPVKFARPQECGHRLWRAYGRRIVVPKGPDHGAGLHLSDAPMPVRRSRGRRNARLSEVLGDLPGERFARESASSGGQRLVAAASVQVVDSTRWSVERRD